MLGPIESNFDELVQMFCPLIVFEAKFFQYFEHQYNIPHFLNVPIRQNIQDSVNLLFPT